MKRKEYPIVFVHGWNFKEKKRNNTTYCGWNDTGDGIGGMMGRLRKEANSLLGRGEARYTISPLVTGQDVQLSPRAKDKKRTLWAINYYAGVQTGTYALGLPGYGAYAAQIVRKICRITNSPKVKIVSHSMGTVVSRWAIQKEGIVSRVDTFITMCAPNNGARAANKGKALLAVLDTVLGPLLDLNDEDMKYLQPKWVKRNLGGRYPKVWYRGRRVGLADAIPHCFCLIGCDDDSILGYARDVVSLNAPEGVPFNTGVASDSIVRLDEAYYDGATRMYGYREHTDKMGLNHRLEGFEMVKRCLFGDKLVRITQTKAEISDPHEMVFTEAEFCFEFSVSLRRVGNRKFGGTVLHEVSRRCENAPTIRRRVPWRGLIQIKRDLPVFEGPIITPLARAGRSRRDKSVLFVQVRCLEQDPVGDDTVGEMENSRVDVWVKNEGNETKEFFKAFGDCIGWYSVETSDMA